MGFGYCTHLFFQSGLSAGWLRIVQGDVAKGGGVRSAWASIVVREMAIVGSIGAVFVAICSMGLAKPEISAQAELRALDGEWIFVEDRTVGRTDEQLSPPMGSKFAFRTEGMAVILVSGHGGQRREVRVALDGSLTEVPGSAEGDVARYRGAWKDGAFSYEVDFIRAKGRGSGRVDSARVSDDEGRFDRAIEPGVADGIHLDRALSACAGYRDAGSGAGGDW